MQSYFAALTVVVLIGMVMTRSWLLTRNGIKPIHFGNLDRKDFVIPPSATYWTPNHFNQALVP
jgi:hypothetical protein